MKAMFLAAFFCCLGGSVAAQTIEFRHDLEGKSLDALATLVVRFNDELKGKGRVVLQDVRGVENKRVLPVLALLDPDDSPAFFDTRPRFRPMHEVMRDGRLPLNTGQFYPQVFDAVDDASGRIQALPLALSLPVLFVNREALRKAGLDPDQPIKTWWELQRVAGEVLDHGGKCPLTTGRFAWIHNENISSQAGEAITGRIGRTQKVLINGMVNVKHLALLASWQKSRYFHYEGPAREGYKRFLSGECAMLTGESAVYADARRAGIDIGVRALPYYDDVYAAKPDAVLPDGAALWALAGHHRNDYRLAARFVAFLMKTDVQKEWVKATSYLPMTPAALAALRDSDIPGHLLDAAQKRLSVARKGSTRPRHGVLRDRLHEFLGEEVAFVWTTDRPAKEALDITVRRVNAVLSSPPSQGKASSAKAGEPKPAGG